MNRTIPLSVPPDLLEEIQETARMTHLSVEDVLCQSAKIAAPALRASAGEVRPQGLSLWDALHCGRGLSLDIKPIEGRLTKVAL
ncbi:MAG: hypothetical protein KIS67_00140 [Verrucomicrobiae bacterium]|nr:hypothetical protein [Verrucomicrobiae bacterium]